MKTRRTDFNNFYSGKKVFLTGHTGFKGSWLCLWLKSLGAEVIGFSLDPDTTPNMFSLCKLGEHIKDIRGDILDFEHLYNAIDQAKPQLVFHLAAQAIVKEGHAHPRETFNTNLMGTVNLLEATRKVSSVENCIVVTTDKVYRNEEWDWPYRENDILGGDDAYAASKACAELAVAAYRSSLSHQSGFSSNSGLAIASVRAGNVIGGGDWAKDRLIPDIVSAIASGREIFIRNPLAVRPWQHVLDALSGYLWLGALMQTDLRYCSAWNFGPTEQSMLNVNAIAAYLLKTWGASKTKVVVKSDPWAHEAQLLRLDSNKAGCQLNWRPTMDVFGALDATLSWYRKHYQLSTADMCTKSLEQIKLFSEKAQENNLAWASEQ